MRLSGPRVAILRRAGAMKRPLPCARKYRFPLNSLRFGFARRRRFGSGARIALSNGVAGN